MVKSKVNNSTDAKAAARDNFKDFLSQSFSKSLPRRSSKVYLSFKIEISICIKGLLYLHNDFKHLIKPVGNRFKSEPIFGCYHQCITYNGGS